MDGQEPVLLRRKPIQYKLPDSRIVEFDLKDYNASKVMFEPTLVGKKCLGFDKMVETCIEKVNLNLRESLCDNIKLTGGNCLMRNFNQVMHTILHTSLNKSAVFIVVLFSSFVLLLFVVIL